MARKYELITELYHKTLGDITRSIGAWQDFLRCASYNYKLRFDEQVLLYAQRPTATAVLPLEDWNEKFGRWVNKGSKGIAVFDDAHNGNMRLKHYFDISDTHESRFSRPVPLWAVKAEYEAEIIETLENSFGELAYKGDLESAICSAVSNAVTDNYSDYLSELMNCREGSFLEELDELNVEKYFKDALESSVSYMLLARCFGETADDDDLIAIVNFNTPETLNALGLATSDIAEMALREISATVRNLQIQDKKMNRTFENVQSTQHNRDENNLEGSFDNGIDIHHAGRLQSAESDRAAGAGGSPWEIRIAAQEVSERTPPRDLPQSADIGQAERTPDGDRADGADTDGTAHSADGADRGLDGADESQRPDEMGGIDEQHPAGSGGNRAEQPDTQLTIYPSVEEQIANIEQAEAEKSSAFAISQEDIDEVFQRGSGIVEHGKFRIYLQFEKGESAKENAAFLKEEYGWGGSYPAIRDSQLNEGHDGKGIKISRGSIVEPDAEVLLSWSKAAKRIGELVAADRYLSPREKEQLPAYRQWVQEQAERRAEERAAREILSRAPSAADNQAERENADYRYQLGDTVYIGSSEYEVLAFDENEVRLFDTSFPLLNKVLPRDEFDRKLRENPLNDSLIVTPDNQPETIETQIRDALDWRGYIVSDEVIAEGLNAYDGEGDYRDIADLIEQEYLSQDAEDSPKSLIGKRYLIDGREFVVNSVNEEWDKVSLRDVTFQNGVGFPIFRSETIDFIRAYEPIVDVAAAPASQTKEVIETPLFDVELVEHHIPQPNEPLPAEKETELPPPPAAKRTGKVQAFDIHPEIPQSERHQFSITDDELGYGGLKEKFRANADAINTLHEIEFENRFATPEEQEILSRYVGWGALSKAFEENNSVWANEFVELYTLLSPDEYAAARESTLTAFYTPPTVIRAMYKALENMNFRTGNILEPSCGTGNFIGMLPESMKDSKIYGVELDSITGRIAQQLYQKSSIAVQGFESASLPDSFFDCAIGNVPFGQFKVADKRYDKNNWLIHDYFFGKALDKVRPGGVIAFITSKGTLDKENPAVRKYIAQRADLLGAIRLPNDTFSKNAGTEVTSDIIFLQKRDRIIDIEPDWVHLGKDENGIVMNSYFVEHTDMILGDMVMESTQFGMDSACKAYENADLESLLSDAIANIHAEISDYALEDLGDEEDNSIPADPTVRNFSYTLVDGKIYYRENSRMNPIDVSVTAENRIRGMIGIRDCARTLIEYQTEDYSDADIAAQQAELNRLYDAFSKKYGLINSRANNSVFSTDSSYCLLCSLEILDDEGNFVRKADMFQKRTIKQKSVVTSVDIASEALAISLAEKARVDMAFMSELTGKTEDELADELTGVIFRVPAPENEPPVYQAADEYLSGNVREKLKTAKMAAAGAQAFAPNVAALEKVQPQDLTASEISVRLGATWLPTETVQEFMFELFSTPHYSRWDIKVHFSQYTGEWNIEGKSRDRGNIKVHNTYGTSRINGYKILEETLNLKDVRIFDYVEDADGKKTAVLNKKETAIAQGKQELIKAAFADWVWKEPERREQLCRIYNERFNSLRPREYDGSHLNFIGINPEITLRKHQTDAIAHVLYGGNTLLAHVVGAGKTYEMVAAAQESKRLGLCQKSLFVVPNHLTEQWASEYLQLYPAANILVATKKDFETRNRKKFCGRIATGDYDAVIIGHSQFEKIPMSIERQRAILEQQLDEIISGIAEIKHNRGDRFTVKQLEKTKKSIKLKLDKLNDQSRKDDVVTFEELGVDRLFIDEAHYYKNLFLYTKMRNVGGIAQTEALKSSDLFMKCRYLDELTGGRGIVFATGTPISNSMVEMYTMQRYLQMGDLQRNQLQHFDSWASTFGETVTAIELAPEGTGYRAKTRFAKFYNLPELMMMFKGVADIQTADMLDLPVPKANYHNIVLKPTEQQKEMVASLSDRAERVRNKMVDSSTDNMLLITNDGRKLALDQRLMNELLPDDENSKAAACANNVFEIWERTAEKRSTQLVFCDLSTPHGDGKFNVYDDVKQKLIAKGIPSEEIAFIHEAKTEAKKKELFGKVRSGQIRVLLGSTQKMGAGTNVQNKLIALHHLDCPWRPSDLQQREGRIIRQGNDNPEVEIYSYVTENTFDAYLYQLVESKQKFIGQIMTSKSPVRSAEDIDETALSYAEIKALATGNPHIKEKMDLDIEVSRLKLLKANHLSQRYALEDQILKSLPQQIRSAEERIKGYAADIAHLAENTTPNEDDFSPMIVEGKTYTDKKEAGSAILAACKAMTNPDPVPLGTYRGFCMELFFDSFGREYKVTLKNELRHTVSLGTDIFGNIQRLDNALAALPDRLKGCEQTLENARTQLENAKIEVEKPFPHETELSEKSERLDKLNILLNMDKRENEVDDGERADEDVSERKSKDMER